MNIERPIRGLFASLLLLALLAPYTKPVMCTGTDHGGATMEHVNHEQMAWSSSAHDMSACHGRMGCVSVVTPPVLEQSVAPRDLPVHFEPPVLFLQSAASDPGPPVTPPPKV